MAFSALTVSNDTFMGQGQIRSNDRNTEICQMMLKEKEPIHELANF